MLSKKEASPDGIVYDIMIHNLSTKEYDKVYPGCACGSSLANATFLNEYQTWSEAITKLQTLSPSVIWNEDSESFDVTEYSILPFGRGRSRSKVASERTDTRLWDQRIIKIIHKSKF